MNKKNKIVLNNNIFMVKLILKCCPERLIGEILMQLFETMTSLFMSVVFIEHVFYAIENHESFYGIVKFIVMSVIFLILVQLYKSYYSNVVSPRGNQKLYEKMNRIMFDKVNDVELECYENPKFYKKYTKAASQTKGTALKIIDTLSRMIANTAGFLYVLIKLFIIDKLAVVIAVVPCVAIYYIQKKINKINYEFDMENIEQQRKKEYINRAIYQGEYAKEIRLSNIHKVLFKKFYEANKEMLANIDNYGWKFIKLATGQGLLSGVFLYMIYNVYSIVRLLLLKNITLSGFIILANLMAQLNSDMGMFSSLFARLSGYSRYINNLREFLNYKPKISQSQTGENICWDAENENTIEFRNVNFSYNSSKKVLDNINFTIKKGEKIALVGHNGAGKSTLVKLLMRLYDADSGQILANNKDIKVYNVKNYRSLFSCVFQDYKVLAMTAAQNVLMGEFDDKDRDTVEESMKISGIWQKISSFKNGINTMLTKEFDKGGEVLSGGEMQKITIARMYAKNSEIAVLDEPSSALDPVAEYDMYNSMMRACEDKTVIFISHRMSSAVLADRIILLENGRIVESGSHAELMKKDGQYAKLFEMQAAGYKGEYK